MIIDKLINTVLVLLQDIIVYNTFFRHGRQITMTQWLICPIREFFQDFILVTLSNYEGRHLFQCGHPKVQYLLEGRACLRPGAC